MTSRQDDLDAITVLDDDDTETVSSTTLSTDTSHSPEPGERYRNLEVGVYHFQTCQTKIILIAGDVLWEAVT